MPKNINNKAPISPELIPIYLCQVFFSFKNTADIIKIITGVKVIIIEPLIGVDKLNPLKSIVIFMDIPNRPQAIKRSISLLSIFSEGKNKLNSKKRTAAPLIRKKANPKGSITCGIKFFPIVKLIP